MGVIQAPYRPSGLLETLSTQTSSSASLLYRIPVIRFVVGQIERDFSISIHQRVVTALAIVVLFGGETTAQLQFGMVP